MSKLGKLVLRNLRRRPLRTVLTVGGVASAVLLLVLVESLSGGLDRALRGSEAAKTLIVYRKNRYCPQTSNIPEHYARRIAEVDGVASVLPVKVFLNNCRASLDLVAFQGAPADSMLASRPLELLEGDAEAFRREHDAALVGRSFAARKGLEVGDSFRFGAIDVKVRGIFASRQATEEGVVLTHLEYLQRAGPIDRLGTVTQFEVKLEDPERADEVGREIDALFATAEEPTDTRAQIAFLQSATRDLSEILRFARALGLACVAVVLVLVGNTVLMSVQERVREFGVLRTLGFRERHVGAVVVGESLALAGVGSLLGLGLAFLVVHVFHPTLGSEGVSVSLVADPALALRGAAFALATGLVAGLFPAWRSSRADIVDSLRSA